MISGPSSDDGHAILRLSPVTCIYELAEHCTYAAYVLSNGFSFPLQAQAHTGGLRISALAAARAVRLLLSSVLAIYFSLSELYVPRTVLFCWVYVLRSVSLLVLPCMTNIKAAIPVDRHASVKCISTLTHAGVVHLLACTMIMIMPAMKSIGGRSLEGESSRWASLWALRMS